MRKLLLFIISLMIYSQAEGTVTDNDITIDNFTYTLTSKYYGEPGEAYITEYKGNKSDVVIPSTVTYQNNTYTVVSIKENAFYRKGLLKKITIPSSVKTVDQNAINHCMNLREIEFGEGVETNVGYLDGFYTYDSYHKEGLGCDSLRKITIKTKKAHSYTIRRDNEINHNIIDYTYPDTVKDANFFLMYNPLDKSDINYKIPEGVDSLSIHSDNCGELPEIPSSVKYLWVLCGTTIKRPIYIRDSMEIELCNHPHFSKVILGDGASFNAYSGNVKDSILIDTLIILPHVTGWKLDLKTTTLGTKTIFKTKVIYNLNPEPQVLMTAAIQDSLSQWQKYYSQDGNYRYYNYQFPTYKIRIDTIWSWNAKKVRQCSIKTAIGYPAEGYSYATFENDDKNDYESELYVIDENAYYKYSSADVWKNFYKVNIGIPESIMEIAQQYSDGVPLIKADSDATDNNIYYDLCGRRVSNLETDKVYIHNRKKVMFK